MIKLNKIFPDGKINVWGLTPGEQNKTKWENLEEGDIVIFVPSRDIALLARVVYKIRNKDLAAYLWGTDKERGSFETWELIFFIKIEKSLEIDKRTFLTELLGYNENDVLMGSRRITNRIIENFGSVNNFLDIIDYFNVNENQIKSDIEEELIESEFKKNLNVLKDKLEKTPPEVKFIEYKGKKITRSVAVKFLVKEISGYKCEACGFTFEKKNGELYVECAHIKPLSKSYLDSPNNVAALCPNCHAMLDKGSIKERLKILERLKKNERLADIVEEEMKNYNKNQ
ncbi:MAG: HNH endonuclease [Candidatus Aenigmarchaeota archaeon]|nr:HNH endonuclease [Candidatus Aenigmarchaeota archaeon]